MRVPTTILSAFCVLVGLVPGTFAAQPKNSVLLSKVQTLTLRNGLKTSHRRVSAIPQLKCIGGSAKGLYEVDVLRCKNAGSDYDDDNIQWTCTAQLPEEFKLGSTDVICEGYDSPDDPYILKGSCGVEYRLVLTEKGESKYGHGRGGKRTGRPNNDAGDNTAFSYLFWVLFVGVVIWMLYSAWNAPRTPHRRRAAGGNHGAFGGGGPGGGPGGDNGDDDPPPPYTPRSSFNSNPKPRTSSGSTSGQQSQGWRPGFWSGMVGGGAAGYYMGRNSTQRTYQDRYQERYQDHRGPLGGSYGSGSGSWGNGEGSSGSSSSNSTRYESTGFGSTSRR